MLFARRSAFVVAVTLLVFGCSSGGGADVVPTTITSATSTTNARSLTTASPSHVVSKLGKCPKRYTEAVQGKLNAGIKGLDKKPVPIAAIVVRICKYALAPDANAIPTGLVASGGGVLTLRVATAFEAETNRLPRGNTLINCPATSPPFFVLTFANATQRVDVWEAGGCGFKTNGVFTVGTTTHWLDELRQYTSRR
jgi:hypothetical protein